MERLETLKQACAAKAAGIDELQQILQSLPKKPKTYPARRMVLRLTYEIQDEQREHTRLCGIYEKELLRHRAQIAVHHTIQSSRSYI